MRYTTQKTRNQLWFIHISTCISFIIIVTRLIYLQIYHHQMLNTLGQKNFTRIKYVEPLRGNILDCHGNLLATNRPISNLDWVGSGESKLNTKQKSILQKIEQILQKYNYPLIAPLSKISRAEKFGTVIRLASDLNLQALSEILEQCADSENIAITKKFKRFYPHQELACHVLGYLGDLENSDTSSGKMGLELIFEEELKGKPGAMSHIINSFGKNLHKQSLIHSQSGKDLTLTLDISLQHIAESVMPVDYAGSLILITPTTGDIKALVSKPGFDPSLFLESISPQDWQRLQHNRPFINRAFNASYPPASIFKLVTISAALEHNIITPESTFQCNGYINFKGRKYYCNNRWGHGKLTIKENLAHSCNIACYEIAQKLSIDVIAQYAYKFGLGEKTNIIFPETAGIVPSNAWKKEKKGEPWWKGETLSAAIGQSFLLTTPIQIACMIGSIFTGYVTKPRILLHDSVSQHPLTILPSTLDVLQDSMKSTIITGSGRNLNRLKDITVYAKTGTAQTKTRIGNNKDKQDSCHAWFASYFYYKNHDPLVMVILLENAGGSATAVNVAKKFLSRYIKFIA